MLFTEKELNLFYALKETGKDTFDSKTIYDTGKKLGLVYREVKERFLTEEFRAARGKYRFDFDTILNSFENVADLTIEEMAENESVVAEERKSVVGKSQSYSTDEIFIPSLDSAYIPWGEYSTVLDIIKSRAFLATYIVGDTGNGKTMMVEQACAAAKREYVRVQISPETDESDLIGSFGLVNGETVFNKGPVINAMERGAVLLIDEIDRGSNKLMCLQGVLEGKPVLIKKIGETVYPAKGFNVFATANTKGRGADDGKYTAAVIVDEAFLERFTATIEQPYPPEKIEKEIIERHMQIHNCLDREFRDKLVAWSDIIRKTYEKEGVDEVISTRRLCNIVATYAIFKNRMKAIKLCIGRFDNDTKDAFNELYKKIDVKADEPAPVPLKSLIPTLTVDPFDPF